MPSSDRAPRGLGAPNAYWYNRQLNAVTSAARLHAVMDHAGNLAGRRCVVLGAGGFVGTNLCHQLAREDARVTGFGRQPRIQGSTFPGKWVDGEFDDAPAVEHVLKDADVVFHLLGGSNPSASNNDPVSELKGVIANNLGLIATAARVGVGKFLFVSSGGTVYGPAQNLPIPESAPTDPISAYGLGKLATEKVLRLYHLIESMEYSVLRVANPYGPCQLPDQKQGVVATVLKRALDGRPVQIWGDGSAVRDYLHISDACDAMMRAAVVNDDHRVFNVGSGIGRSLKDIVASVSHVLGVEIAVEYLPGRPADIPANVLDCTLAEQVLGWTPRIQWEDGLRTTSQWLAALPAPA
jgi:UDP-glucose 4-epimerase